MNAKKPKWQAVCIYVLVAFLIIGLLLPSFIGILGI